MTNIELIRRKIGITQGELAAMAGVNQATVSRWENGRGEPSMTQVARVIAASGGAVQPNDFYTAPSSPAAATPQAGGPSALPGAFSSKENGKL